MAQSRNKISKSPNDTIKVFLPPRVEGADELTFIDENTMKYIRDMNTDEKRKRGIQGIGVKFWKKYDAKGKLIEGPDNDKPPEYFISFHNTQVYDNYVASIKQKQNNVDQRINSYIENNNNDQLSQYNKLSSQGNVETPPPTSAFQPFYKQSFFSNLNPNQPVIDLTGDESLNLSNNQTPIVPKPINPEIPESEITKNNQAAPMPPRFTTPSSSNLFSNRRYTVVNYIPAPSITNTQPPNNTPANPFVPPTKAVNNKRNIGYNEEAEDFKILPPPKKFR